MHNVIRDVRMPMSVRREREWKEKRKRKRKEVARERAFRYGYIRSKEDRAGCQRRSSQVAVRMRRQKSRVWIWRDPCVSGL